MAKLNDKIAREKKRRARQQREGKVRSAPIRLKATNSERDQFTQRAAPILLKIEEVICGVADLEELSDAGVEAAIRASLQGTAPVGPKSQSLAKAFRDVQADLGYDDETWQTGLRIIYRSLTTRSECRRGETSYLDYARHFVNNAPQ